MAALQNVLLPEVSYDEESEKTTISDERTLPLQLKVLYCNVAWSSMFAMSSYIASLYFL